MRRQLLTATVTTLVIAALGGVVGFVWQAISPSARYVVIEGKPVLADPETQALISIDGRYASLTALAGLICGVAVYLAAGRGTDAAMAAGLALGGIGAALLAWRLGHQVGLPAFEHAVRGAKDGTFVTGVADLRARGVLVFWPMTALGTFGLLEILDPAGRHRAVSDDDDGLFLGDGRQVRGGEPGQIGGGEFDLQAAPTGRNEDGREP
ncbi:MAG TPA: hypothetical protein VFU43_22090 [Streptosporangiaceae bacterium]|nr:hypothetical protein [Streptosporangiaceae bacterium]